MIAMCMTVGRLRVDDMVYIATPRSVATTPARKLDPTVGQVRRVHSDAWAEVAFDETRVAVVATGLMVVISLRLVDKLERDLLGQAGKVPGAGPVLDDYLETTVGPRK